MVRSKFWSVTFLGRSRRSGLPHLAHLGPADRRARSTRFAAEQKGQATMTGRAGGLEVVVRMGSASLNVRNASSKVSRHGGQGNCAGRFDCACRRRPLVIAFTDRNCRRGISVAYTRKGVSHREDGSMSELTIRDMEQDEDFAA